MDDPFAGKWKPIVCLDFDGVLHSYVSGWKEIDHIPDPPVPGAIQMLEEYTKHFKVCIFSSRSRTQAGIEAMAEWLLYHGLAGEILEKIEFPTQKPPAFVTIDDRAICFEGEFPSPEAIRDFKPWFKKMRR